MSGSVEDLIPELKAIANSLETVVGSAASAPAAELDESIWLLYARLERVVSIMKLRLSIEQPGVPRPVQRPKTEPSEFFVVAVEKMGTALSQIDAGEYLPALLSAQAARNSLRFYLSARRRIRMAESRTTRRAGRSR